jgi:hypothetical protein
MYIVIQLVGRRGVFMTKHMTSNQICGLNKNPCVVEFGSSLASAHLSLSFA